MPLRGFEWKTILQDYTEQFHFPTFPTFHRFPFFFSSIFFSAFPLDIRFLLNVLIIFHFIFVIFIPTDCRSDCFCSFSTPLELFCCFNVLKEFFLCVCVCCSCNIFYFLSAPYSTSECYLNRWFLSFMCIYFFHLQDFYLFMTKYFIDKVCSVVIKITRLEWKCKWERTKIILFCLCILFDKK